LPDYRLFIANLPFTATEEQLREFFSSWLTVSGVKILHNAEGKSRCLAYVEVGSEDDVGAGCELNGLIFRGRELRIEKAQPKR
jgi:RNA recognition motif-containing protein